MRTTHRWLSTLVILVVATSCDNVSWGGIDLRLEGPPVTEATVTDSAVVEVALPELPAGPVLFRLDRSGNRGSLSPVAEIVGDSLSPLTDEETEPGFREYFVQQRMAAGQEFVLYADGSRVGRFIAEESGAVAAEICGQPPVIEGLVELIPGAATTNRFLALAEGDAPDAPRGTFSLGVVDQATRVTAANVAGTVIMDAGARWPPSMAAARGDVQVLHMSPDEPALIAGTYLYQDQMALVPAVPASYSFFYLAENRGIGHRYSYYWFRVAGNDGKGAARYFGHMDWDGDGVEEVLLEVIGATERWHAALARTTDGWARTYEDPCGAPERQVQAAG